MGIVWMIRSAGEIIRLMHQLELLASPSISPFLRPEDISGASLMPYRDITFRISSVLFAFL